MSLNNYNIRHVLNESVILTDLDIDGRVEEISIGNFGIIYKVCYWNNGERHSTWVSEYEIKNKNSKE